MQWLPPAAGVGPCKLFRPSPLQPGRHSAVRLQCCTCAYRLEGGSTDTLLVVLYTSGMRTPASNMQLITGGNWPRASAAAMVKKFMLLLLSLKASLSNIRASSVMRAATSSHLQIQRPSIAYRTYDMSALLLSFPSPSKTPALRLLISETGG